MRSRVRVDCAQMRAAAVVAVACVVAFAVATVAAAAAAAGPNWGALDEAIESAIANKAFPGAVAIVGDRTGLLYAKPFGFFTYGDVPPYSGSTVPPMSLGTQFDMASCTKVISTNTAVAMLYQSGLIALDTPVCAPQLLGPAFAQNGKATITVRNLLLHNAGYPPDPVPWYWDPAFGCPQSQKPVPAEDWSCRTAIYNSIFTQTLDRAVGASYVYSDLSFITLAYIVGKVVTAAGIITPSDYLPGCMNGETSDAATYQCAYEAYVRLEVFEPLGMANTGFLPPQPQWGNCAPAENFTAYPQYPNKPMQGQVSDGNAYSMGGIAGHAGLFSTAPDVAIYMHAYMFGLSSAAAAGADADAFLFPRDATRRAFGGGDGDFTFLNASTVKLWIKEANNTQSSRALGWNTNDPTAFDEGWNLSCGSMSPQTFLHTGYTGTEVCGDPVNEFYTVLLTNRVYPTDSTGSDKVHAARVAYNTAALNAVLATRQMQQSQAQAQTQTQTQTQTADEEAVEAVAAASKSAPVYPMSYPLYKQCNSSWGSDLMQTQTICAVGCLMSSVSMALAANAVTIDGNVSTPATLNTWLRDNNGYAGDNDLDETKVPGINPSRIHWDGFYYNNTSLPPATIKQMLDNAVVVIANVMNGGHFVLLTGYDDGDVNWYVNDPGFDRASYTYDDIVGYRIFSIV